jgi:hypothetical protein
MERPIRIQRSRKKGWRKPPNTVIVDRSSKWGNPYEVGIDGTREECIEKYKEYFYRELYEKAVKELRGKNVACWCKLTEPCHADFILEAVN